MHSIDSRPCLAAVLGLVLFAWPASTPAAELRVVGQIRSPGPVTSEASKKIVSRLRGLIADFRALGVTRQNAAAMDVATRFSSETLKVDTAGRVQVYVTVTDTTDPALARLRSHGLDVEIVNTDFGIVQGWIPVDTLESLAAEAAVTRIRPPSYGTTRTGSVNSQGTAIHRCDQVQAGGITGAGTKIGVISDGVAGLATSQATGDLPAVQVLSAGSGDEGTAMLEIVHDCAPGAMLAFSSGFPTSLSFINAVNGLRAAGAHVIVDDLGFFSQPFFQDGEIALNDRVAGAAAVRVSSAGNDRLRHYQANFSPGSLDPELLNSRRHNFGGGDEFMRFRIPAGGMGTIVFQWADPFGGSGNDHDLCVREGGALIACADTIQDGDDDPIEILTLSCVGPAGSFCLGDIQITLFFGVGRPLELFCLRCTLDEFNVAGDSIIGHPAVPEVVAVAAAPASSPSTIESFSSAGPSTILFPAPATRSKPDVTGIDGVSTTRPGFNPFFGTSAAAPHVAAILALMRQRNPGLTPAELRAILTTSAVDLAPAGFDFSAGFGRADAVNAVAATPLPFFAGGVYVAVGDVNGDGAADIVTGPGAGGGPHVRVLSGLNLAELASFFAFTPGFTGGVRVAAGDVNGDGRADLIVAPGPGGGPHVRVFSGIALPALSELASFFAYSPGFAGGLFVAAGDVNGDGRADLITGPDAGGGPHVRVFSGIALPALLELASFFAYPAGFAGGVFVAAGNVTGTAAVEILTGAGPGGGPHVRGFTGTGLDAGVGFFAYVAGFTGGVRVAAGNTDGAGLAEIVTAPGPPGGPHVRGFTGTGAPTSISFFAY